MMRSLLQENLSYDQAHIVTESAKDGKNLYMKGICMQGDVKNANQRIYPVKEIARAVEHLNQQIKDGYSILGEADHPEGLNINIDRITHTIEELWMEGANGYGKLKILSTPMGNIVKTMLEEGVKLGVSTRGSGDVNESTGMVSNFEMVTVDVVAQPSAPHAYPTAIYEGLLNMRGGHKAFDMAAEVNVDKRVQRHLTNEVVRLIKELKL